jgi:hypothetical protein
VGRRKLERRKSLRELANQVVTGITGKSVRCDLCKRVIQGEVHWKIHSATRKIPMCAKAPACIEGG